MTVRVRDTGAWVEVPGVTGKVWQSGAWVEASTADPTYGELVLADAPLGYWPFDETVGTTAADSSGNALNGTIVGATLAQPGKVGTAFSFDGSDYVDCGAPASVIGATVMSWEAWIKTTTASGNIITWDDSDLANRSRKFRLRVSASKANMMVFTSNTTPDTVASLTSVDDGVLHHVAATYDGATIRVFVDGVEEASKAFAGNLNTVSGANARLGIGARRSVGSWTEFFTGTIDEPAVYNTVLVAADFAARVTAAA